MKPNAKGGVDKTISGIEVPSSWAAADSSTLVDVDGLAPVDVPSEDYSVIIVDSAPPLDLLQGLARLR